MATIINTISAGIMRCIDSPGSPETRHPGSTQSAATWQRWIVALLCVCALAAIVDVSTFGLMDKDEGAYASIGRAMARTGDFVTPKLLGKPYFEKPPLLYWGMALAIKTFGASERSVRLPSVISFSLILAALCLWGNRRFGKGVGAMAALMFALSPLVMGISRIGTTDMLLCCCFTIALIAMWETASKPLWCIPLGVATGFAVLTKGPVGLGLVGLQTLLAARILRLEGLRARWLGVSLLLATAISAPWYVSLYLDYGGSFFQTFIVKQNLLRFAGGDSAHAVRQPLLYLLYYVMVLAVGLFPFSVFVRGAAWSGGPPVCAYLRRWTVLVFGFFTLSLTKLPSYILPVVPAIALLAAYSWVMLPASVRALRLSKWALTAGAIVWTAMAFVVFKVTHNAWPIAMGPGLVLVGLAILVPGRLLGQAVFSPARGRITDSSGRYILVLGLVVCTIGAHFWLVSFDSTFMKPVRTLALEVPSGRKLTLWKMVPAHPSILFYRNDGIVNADSEADAAACMTHGGCNLTDSSHAPGGHWVVVDKARAYKQTFLLLDAKR